MLNFFKKKKVKVGNEYFYPWNNILILEIGIKNIKIGFNIFLFLHKVFILSNTWSNGWPPFLTIIIIIIIIMSSLYSQNTKITYNTWKN